MKKNLYSFYFSDVFSTLGGTIFITTIAIYIASVLEDPIFMGKILLLSGISRIIGGVFSGTIVDTFGAKKCFIISLFVRIFISIIIFAVLIFHLNKTLFFITILFGFVDSFQWPALEVIKKEVFDKNLIIQSNSQLFVLNKGITILAPLIATFFISIMPYEYIFLLLSFTFLISIILMFTIKMKNESKTTPNKIFRNFKDSFLYIKNDKNLCYLILLIASVNLCANGIFISLPYLMPEINSTAKNMTLLSTAMSIGLILGGLIISKLNELKISINIINIGFFIQGLSIALVVLTSNIFDAIFVFVLIGIATSFSGVLISSFLQKKITKDKIGRVSSVIMVLTMSTTPIAQFIFGILINNFLVKNIFLYGGLYQISICIILYILFNKKYRLIQ